MPQSKRLRELHKQKELLQSHLQWLDSEIAKEDEDSQTLHSPQTEDQSLANRIDATTPSPATQAIPVSKEAASEDPPQEQAVEDIYAELGPNTKSAAAQTKTGCLIAFAVAIALLAAGVGAIYYFY